MYASKFFVYIINSINETVCFPYDNSIKLLATMKKFEIHFKVQSSTVTIVNELLTFKSAPLFYDHQLMYVDGWKMF